MTIVQTARYIVSHPAFIHALNELQDGNDKEMEQLLGDYGGHIYLRCTEKSPRTYGLNKHKNTADIAEALRRMDVPDLDLRLAIPKTAEKVSLHKRVVKKFKDFIDEKQLVFPFIQQTA